VTLPTLCLPSISSDAPHGSALEGLLDKENAHADGFVSLIDGCSVIFSLDAGEAGTSRGLRTTCLSAVVRFLAITVLLDLRENISVPPSNQF
jgi:hypothetical protein